MTRARTRKAPTTSSAPDTQCTTQAGHTDSTTPATGKSSYEKWGKSHYERNKEAYKKRAAEQKKRGRKEWDAFKATLSCVHCGEDHPATFDFHHVIRGPDNHKVHKLLGGGQYAKAKEEIKKCIVLCANCHRKLHWEEAQHKKLAKKARKKPLSSV